MVPVGTAGLALVVLVARDGSLGWRVLRSGLVVAAVILAVRTSSSTGRAFVALFGGVVAASVGAGFLPHLVEDGPSVTSVAAVASVVAGLSLVVIAAIGVVDGARRAVAAGSIAACLMLTAAVGWVVTPAVAVTNVPDAPIGPDPTAVGLGFETVELTTADGVALAAWYVPSMNQAAVVLRHGAGSTRSSVLHHAAVLAGHGYGVLLVDARGHGASGGRAMDFGWYGDLDIQAATAFLARRPDVAQDHIGVVGLSMGGEEAIGATGSNPLIRAVVAEGATARTASDNAWLSDAYGIRGWIQEQVEHLRDGLTDLLTDASPPDALRTAVRAATSTRFLLITAGAVADELRAARYIRAASPERVEIWTVPRASHTGGLRTDRNGWERNVIRFLDRWLEPASPTKERS